MAAGTIISVASNIPWGQVLDAAPKVADAAVKLWGSIKNRNKQDTVEDRIEHAANDAGLSEVEQLTERVEALEDRVAYLQDQLRSSTEVLKNLAEQNTLLVHRVELNRKRLNRQLVAAGAVALGMMSALVYLLLRS